MPAWPAAICRTIPLWPEDELIPLSKQAQFAARHVLTSRPGVALHINAFNFPCWGMLEKLAPTWLAGMPAIIKPATATAQLTQAMVRLIVDSGLVPEGALQLVCGGVGDMFAHLDYQDAVTFTGSAQTGQRLRAHPRLLEKSIAFTMEADSLNCCVLAEDVTPEMPEFALFIKEVCREMTAKAGAEMHRDPPHHRAGGAGGGRASGLVAAPGGGDGRRPAAGAGAHGGRWSATSSVMMCKARWISCCATAANRSVARRWISWRFWATVRAAGRFIRRPCCIAPIRSPIRRCTAREAFGPVATLMPYADTEQAIALALLGQGQPGGIAGDCRSGIGQALHSRGGLRPRPHVDFG